MSNVTQQNEQLKRLTAQERIAAILDEGSFVELDKRVRRSNAVYGFEDKSAPGEGVVAGYGSIEGRGAFICAQDAAVLGGSCSAAHADKIVKALGLAAKTGQPAILIFDSLGARVQEGAAALDAYARIMKKLTDISGVIPTIAVVAGSLHGTAAMLPALCDFVLSIDGISDLSLRTSTVLCSAEGKAPEVVGTAKAQAAGMGIAHVACADEKECAETLKRLLSFLPSNNLDVCPYYEDGFYAPAGADEGEDIAAIRALVDGGDFMQLQADYASDMIIGFAHMSSQSVGIIATKKGSFITAEGCRKAARFIRVLDAFDMPVITIADSEGVDADIAAESGTLLADMAKLVYAYGEAGVPMVTLIAGKAIGEGYTLMGAKNIGADMAFAYPDAKISCMNKKAGAVALYRDELATDAAAAEAKYEELFMSPDAAAEQGLIDDIIEPAAAKAVICSALDMLAGKREAKLAKKHGVMPL